LGNNAKTISGITPELMEKAGADHRILNFESQNRFKAQRKDSFLSLHPTKNEV